MENNWALIQNGKVVDSVVWDGESYFEGSEYLVKLPEGFGSCIGWDYQNETFYPPKPYNSWVFDYEKWSWMAPVERPNDYDIFEWSENAQKWVLVAHGIQDYEVK